MPECRLPVEEEHLHQSLTGGRLQDDRGNVSSPWFLRGPIQGRRWYLPGLTPGRGVFATAVLIQQTLDFAAEHGDRLCANNHPSRQPVAV